MSDTGDWYCLNCGYLADSRVTNSETCDECHQPVYFHTVAEARKIDTLTDELTKANEQLEQANALLDECLTGYSSESNSDVYIQLGNIKWNLGALIKAEPRRAEIEWRDLVKKLSTKLKARKGDD